VHNIKLRSFIKTFVRFRRVLDLEPMLPAYVTARQLLHDLDDFEESLGDLVLRSFEPPSR
jgi:hypothetical protein